MNESEQALLDATAANSKQNSRNANYVLSDPDTHQLWESRHAELVRPVAEQGNRAKQVLALRDIEIQLIHKRTLFNHIRKNQLRVQERAEMYSAFCAPKNLHDAILMEHRQYMLSVSCHVSTDHLITVMQDPPGKRLLEQFEMLFTNQFDLYGYIIRCDDAVLENAVQPLMAESRKQIADLQ